MTGDELDKFYTGQDHAIDYWTKRSGMTDIEINHFKNGYYTGMVNYRNIKHARKLHDTIILKTTIEMESMKTANKEREINGSSLAYSESDFMDLISKLDETIIKLSNI